MQPTSPDAKGVIFVCPGQGAQSIEMGRDLLASEPAFELAIERCEQAFAPYVSWSLRELLADPDASALLERIDVVQPAMQTLTADFREALHALCTAVAHSAGIASTDEHQGTGVNARETGPVSR